MMSTGFQREVLMERRAVAYMMAGLFFGLAAIFSGNHILLGIPLFILIVIAVNYFYVIRAAGGIRFLNEPEELRLFAGDEGKITFSFANVGRVPIVNADWMPAVLDPDEGIRAGGSKAEGGYRPIVMAAKETLQYAFPVSAEKRGYARVSGVTVRVRDLLGLYTIRLIYSSYIKKGILVYPVPRAFPLPSGLSRLAPGDTRERRSLFDERTMPRGSRSYMPGDPFSSIAWKETARTRELRTREYERVVLTRWIFAADLGGERPGAADRSAVESVFGQIAYAARAAAESGIEFEVRLNIPRAGIGTYLHVDPGTDRAHLSTVYELLARLPGNAPAGTTAAMYRSIGETAARGHVLFHFGKWGEDASGIERLLRKKGVPVHRVPVMEEAEN